MQSRAAAIKVLDNALSSAAGESNCQVFVEYLGLKPLFAAFMGKVRSSIRSQQNSAQILK